MKKITVRLSTLMEILTQMKHDNVDFVEMDLVGMPWIAARSVRRLSNYWASGKPPTRTLSITAAWMKSRGKI